jgi:outer membrane protein OmpA-like peptidoglycan-associated protein
LPVSRIWQWCVRRARAVVAAVVALGIAGNRLTPVGVGPVAPVANNGTEDGRALNHRVELVERL